MRSAIVCIRGLGVEGFIWLYRVVMCDSSRTMSCICLRLTAAPEAPMGLPRRDVRAKVDDDVHRDLVACCNLDGVDIAEYIEKLIVRDVKKRIGDAIELVKRAQRSGQTETRRERQA